jgi:hypothetical protein
MICNIPLLAMQALQRKQTAIAKQESAKKIKRWWHTQHASKEASKGHGPEIKKFDSSKEHPIVFKQLEKNNKGEWYPTPEDLTALLNTYRPLKEYIPGMPAVMVEKSNAKGIRNTALFVAYRNAHKKSEGSFAKGKPLFFLKISRSDLQDIPEKLDELQKGAIGRFGLKAMSNPELPIIVLQEMFFIYRGNDNKKYTIEVMHLAHGEDLSVVIDHHDENNQQWAQKVGKALALFHLEFMNYRHSKDPAAWTTMVHGDFHLGNVFFDEKTSRVYFIDNAGMEMDNPYKDLEFLASLMMHGFSDAVDSPASFKLLNFIRYFIKGYLSAYPLEKRTALCEYLKQQLNVDKQIKLARREKSINVRIQFKEDLYAIFAEACK